jgi:cell division septation protein DedD
MMGQNPGRRRPKMVILRPSMDRATVLLVRAVSLLIIILILSHMDGGAVWAESSYGIQVASYQDLDAAVDRVNYLKRLGHNAFYRYEEVDNKGKWYRVYIEQFPSKEQAEQEASALKELELITDYEIKELNESKPAKTKVKPQTTQKKEEMPPPKSADKSQEAEKTSPKQTTKPAPKPKKDRNISNVIFLLHVSSFKEKDNAAKKVRMLESAGQKAFFVEEELSGGTWYRVYIGKYKTEKAARAAGESLKKTGHISYYKPLKINRNSLK